MTLNFSTLTPLTRNWGIKKTDAEIDELVYELYGLTDEEKAKSQTLRELFKTNRVEALAKLKLRKYHGSKPGPK